jgi:hypothetical protein
MRFDVSENPDPKAWLALDESKRIDLVIDFLRHNHLTLGGSDKLHGAVHMIVENQFALGDATVVPASLDRLMREGLDRHEAVRAIGSVFIGMIFDAVTKKDN